MNANAKEAFEPTGLIPRSIIRTVDRFFQQLLPGREKIAIQEYRVSRYQILVSIKSLLSLVFIPLIVNYAITSLLLRPLIEHFWNSYQNEIFLNQYQERRAFAEMQDFSEKMIFECLSEQNSDSVKGCLIPTTENEPISNASCTTDCSPSVRPHAMPQRGSPSVKGLGQEGEKNMVQGRDTHDGEAVTPLLPWPITETEEAQGRDLYAYKTQFQLKSLELAKSYNNQSILAITHLLGDFVTFSTLYFLFTAMRPEIIILKSFLTESVYSLSDTTKSFLLILGMDLLVGFHSPRGWEIALSALLRHVGLPENENFILLFVALFPVFLDTVFKYWIFRYLNKISPSTVVTYHSMIE